MDGGDGAGATPREAIARLNAELVKIIRDPAGEGVALGPPVDRSRWEARRAEVTAILRAEGAKWARIVKDAGIEVE